MKRVLLSLGLLLLAFQSSAAYLYWTVGYDDGSGVVSGEDSEGYGYLSFNGHVITEVNLWGMSGGSSTKLQTTDVYTALDWNAYGAEGAETYTYYLELVGYASGSSGQTIGIGVSETKSWSELQSAGHVAASLTDVPQAWTGGTFNVPEPGSGLMFLLGAALLGLRRRKV